MAIEETMASVAHSQVTGSLPSLDSYIIGFQLIDSDEDKNAAIGVEAALMGDTAIFLPVVFRDGKIDPIDIMYLPEVDRFLPAQDNFVSYLKARKTDLFASLDKSNGFRGGSGKAGSVNLTMPFNTLVKTASGYDDIQAWVKSDGGDGLTKLAGELMREVMVDRLVTELGVPSVMDVLSKQGSSILLNTIKMFPTTHNAFVRYYTNEDLNTLISRTEANSKITGSIKPLEQGEVKVLTSASADARGLSDAEKSTIIRDGAVIKDTRGLTPSLVFRTKQTDEWQTIGQPGLCEVLKNDGNTMTAYVVPGVDAGIELSGKYYVIPLDDGMARKVYEIDYPIVGQSMPFTDYDMPSGYTIDQIRQVPENSNNTCCSPCDDERDRYVNCILIDKGGDSLRISGQLGKNAWTNGEDRSLGGVRLDVTVPQYGYGGRSACDNVIVRTIVKMPIDAKLRVYRETLYVPESCKLYQFAEHGECLPLASANDLVRIAENRDKLLGVKVYHTDALFSITDKTGVTKEGLDKIAAAETLVRDYFVTPDEARTMVKEASVKLNHQERYLLKIASEAMFSASLGDLNQGVEYTFENRDLNNSLSTDARQQIEAASKSGVKEVLDVTILKTLAQESSSVHQVQSFIPDFFSAMDKAARLLYVSRAGDAMTAAYGEGQINALKSRLKKLVADLGDLIIYLQQGRIDDVHDLLEGPLSDSLG